MHIAPPIIGAAYKKRIRHHHPADVTPVHVTSAVHITHTPGQGGQQRKPQHNLDSVNRTVRLVHTVFLQRLAAKQQHHNNDDEDEAERASANPNATGKQRRE
jgi:hypothetical protein